MVTDPSGSRQAVDFIGDGYKAGDPGCACWSDGALNNIREAECLIRCGEGVQELTIEGMDAGVILERLLITEEGFAMPESYLGPQESWYRKSKEEQQ